MASQDGDARQRPKHRRRTLTLLQKVAILDKLKTGVAIASLSREIDVNESTIRTIRASEQKIRQSVRIISKTSANVAKICRRDPVLEKMEVMLASWIEEQKTQQNILLDAKTVRDKAKIIYYVVAEQMGVPSKINGFQASKGWYENFKRRSNPLNAPVPIKDEPKEEALEPEFYSVSMDDQEWQNDGDCVGKIKLKKSEPVEYETENNDDNMSDSQDSKEDNQPLRSGARYGNEDDDDDSDIDAQSISTFMKKIGFLKNLILEMDPDTERSCKVNRNLDKAMLPYFKIMGQMKRGKNKKKHNY